METLNGKSVDLNAVVAAHGITVGTCTHAYGPKSVYMSSRFANPHLATPASPSA